MALLCATVAGLSLLSSACIEPPKFEGRDCEGDHMTCPVGLTCYSDNKCRLSAGVAPSQARGDASVQPLESPAIQPTTYVPAPPQNYPPPPPPPDPMQDISDAGVADKDGGPMDAAPRRMLLDAGTAPDSGILPPGTQGPFCSVTAQTQLSVHFENHCTFAVQVSWINYQCNEVPFSSLDPGMPLDVTTYVTHSWLIRAAGTGEELAILPNITTSLNVFICGQ